MSKPTVKPPNSPKKRDDVLSKVQDMLHQTLEKALQDLAILDKERAEAMAPPPKLAGCLQGLEKRLQAAQATAVETELALADGEKVLRDYMSRAEMLRQKLAGWATRA